MALEPIAVRPDGYDESWDQYLVGIIATYNAGALKVEGELLSNTDAFGEDWVLEIDTEHTLSQEFSLLTETFLESNTDTVYHAATLGVQYNMNAHAFILGKTFYGEGEFSDGEGFDLKGVELGLGFVF